jgi:hypothetical protein
VDGSVIPVWASTLSAAFSRMESDALDFMSSPIVSAAVTAKLWRLDMPDFNDSVFNAFRCSSPDLILQAVFNQVRLNRLLCTRKRK